MVSSKDAARRSTGPTSRRPGEPRPHRARLRLVVIQALVFSLFATLFVRLYYLQVVSGAEYHAQAASQSVRDIVVQPQRGLVVDDQGRPLATNRPSWVISVDRSMLDKMTDRQRGLLLERLGRTVDLKPARIEERLVTCGDAGSIPGSCWNGSPFQPVPVARDVPQAVALRILEQPEDHPSVLAEQQTVRAYPRPFGVNAAHLLGYLSPITESEYDAAQANGDRSVNGASSVGRAGVEKQYDAWLRGMPGYRKVAVDSMGRVLGDDGEIAGQPGDTLVTSIDAKVQGVVEKQLATTIRTARQTLDPVSGRRYAADSGAAVVLEADTGTGGRDGQPADVRPQGVGRRDQREAAPAALLRQGRHPAAEPGHPGAVRPRLHLEAVHDGRRADPRLRHRHPPGLQLGLPGREPGVQELRVGRLRLHRLRQGARGLLQHLLLPRRLPATGRSSAPTWPT